MSRYGYYDGIGDAMEGRPPRLRNIDEEYAIAYSQTYDSIWNQPPPPQQPEPTPEDICAANGHGYYGQDESGPRCYCGENRDHPVCPECGEFKPDDDRVKAGMKCGPCAYGAGERETPCDTSR